jgi:coenzyme F420 hydrogenase subunit beta
MSIELKSGDEALISLQEYHGNFFRLGFFSPDRCILCGDGTCESAEISFGDAWLPEFVGEKKSVIISRNQVGEAFLQRASSMDKIEITRIPPSKALQSQQSLISKRKGLKTALMISNLLRRGPRLFNLSISTLYAMLIYGNMYASKNSFLRSLLRSTPSSFFKVYSFVESHLERLVAMRTLSQLRA